MVESHIGHKPATVVVIDDHHTFADLLSVALEREADLKCIGQASSVGAGVDLCASLAPDVVVLDYRLADGDGLQAAELILARDPQIRIIMLTGNPTAHAVQRAASIGICGFFPKDGSLSVLLKALRTVRTGEFMVAPSLIASLGTPQQPAAPLLTAREMDVLRLMAQGYDVASNSRTLGISTNTCRGYVKSILSKLEAHSQLEAVAAAQRRGLLGNE